MRRMSRKHCVNSDWFFDSVILTPNMSVKYVHTNQQIADSLSRKILPRATRGMS